MVTPLIRAVWAAHAKSDEIVACHVTPEWSSGLTVAGEPDWPAPRRTRIRGVRDWPG
ncbi:hypothetical protein [Actinomadura bangladeshensis]|uniref:hypothetical protein n=1 Tax=Actinomadura bangladeshensis TaxID=453573 RepID=UPI00140459E0|nr:hypothetical protein [Actinomadura bangladeshensis]